MRLFRPPSGLKGMCPRVFEEQEEWVKAGLIEPFDDDSNADEVVAEMLRAVREHMTNARAHNMIRPSPKRRA